MYFIILLDISNGLQVDWATCPCSKTNATIYPLSFEHVYVVIVSKKGTDNEGKYQNYSASSITTDSCIISYSGTSYSGTACYIVIGDF